MHLAAERRGFGVAVDPAIGLQVTDGGGARPELPMVDVLALGGIARDDPLAIQPGQDAPGVFGRGQAIVNGLQVHKGKAIVIGPAVGVDPAGEPPLRLQPERLVGRLADGVSALSQARWRLAQRA